MKPAKGTEVDTVQVHEAKVEETAKGWVIVGEEAAAPAPKVKPKAKTEDNYGSACRLRGPY